MSDQDQEFERVAWSEQEKRLADALRNRGRDVPEGASVTLEDVPASERNAQGLPLFRAVLRRSGKA